MKSEDYCPHCVDHPRFLYQQLLFQQKPCKSRILCNVCLFSKEFNELMNDYVNKIPLDIIMNSPEEVINHLNKQGAAKLQGIFKSCEYDLEKLFNYQIAKFAELQNIFALMKEQATQKLKEYQQVQVKLKKSRDELFENCNINILKELITQLKEFEKQCKSDQNMQIIGEINQTIEEIIKDDCQLITNNINEMFQSHQKMKIQFGLPNIEQIQAQIIQIFQGYSNFIEELNNNINSRLFEIPQFKVLNKEFYKRIEQKVESGLKQQINSLNLIYLGSIDGLNASEYWNKVNGKSNLLIILQSQENEVFGGYSPCQWEKCQEKWKQDETLTSFLFSETKNKIYPLDQDNKQYAICCDPNYGPWFGYGNDLQINADFNYVTSRLGHTYILDQKYNREKKLHLLGEYSTKIVECEIYEILF